MYDDSRHKQSKTSVGIFKSFSKKFEKIDLSECLTECRNEVLFEDIFNTIYLTGFIFDNQISSKRANKKLYAHKMPEGE